MPLDSAPSATALVCSQANAVELTKAQLRAVLAHVPADPTRSNLYGAAFVTRREAVYLCATDGHTLVLFPAIGTAPASNSVCPAGALKDALRLATNRSTIRIGERGGRWTVRVDGVTIPVDDEDRGAFPDVWQVFPSAAPDAPAKPIMLDPDLLARLALAQKAEGSKTGAILYPVKVGAFEATEWRVGRFVVLIMPMRLPDVVPPRAKDGGR